MNSRRSLPTKQPTTPDKVSGPVISRSNLQFFRARAAEARADAEEATLEHVRERCLRSEAAWASLADRAERSEIMREAEAKRKAQLAAD